MSIEILRSQDRGSADMGWLDTRYSFSFADYFDPARMGFRALRVINEDVIQAGQGFGQHGHRHMEIVTYIIRGALEHRDSTGSRAVLSRGQVQRMSAGSGIQHSEFNASPSEDLKLLQIWIRPKDQAVAPGYEDKDLPVTEMTNRLQPIATPDGRDGALTIHQDVSIFASRLDAGASLTHDLAPGRGAWVQVVDGALTVNGEELTCGDGAAVEDVGRVQLIAAAPSEFLLFDLA